MRHRLWKAFAVVIMFLAVASLGWSLVRPSNDRDWVPDQAVLSTVEIDGDTVTVRNVRNSVYRSTTDYDLHYEDRTYSLSKLDSVWYIVEPFSDWEGAAHTFLSFGFGDQYLGISVEIRKEKGEAFSAWKGLFKQYEILYVAGDERDLIGLRANHRKDQVFVYPAKVTPEKARELFLSMAARMNALAEKPEFYNTLTNTCTTNVVRHVNTISPGRISLSPAIFAPGYSDQFAYDLGLIDTDAPLEQIRERYKVNDKAAKYADSPDFSMRIRSVQETKETKESNE